MLDLLLLLPLLLLSSGPSTPGWTQGSLADLVYLGLLLNTPRTSSAGMERCLGRLFRRIMTDDDVVGGGRSEEGADDPPSREEGRELSSSWRPKDRSHSIDSIIILSSGLLALLDCPTPIGFDLRGLVVTSG
mmetsp:Transcript_22617/g.53397  ORF Transcript_22617/g.53397 Transcript_22617/m.53397 type:complete len:132 (-) Transcript_22617:274-669(-)